MPFEILKMFYLRTDGVDGWMDGWDIKSDLQFSSYIVRIENMHYLFTSNLHITYHFWGRGGGGEGSSKYEEI